MNKGIKKLNKLKRKVISLETKTTILKRIAEGEGSTALGKEFGLGESTIRGIQKRAGEIKKSSKCATNESAKRASYSRNILIEKTEEALILWIQELTQKQILINGDLIKEKAIQLYNQLKDLESSCSSSHIRSSKFSASNGWLGGFLQRHALQNLKIKGEAESTNETAVKNYYKMLAKIIEDGGYCPDQVFNADESGLLCEKMPSQTFISKSEKTASGFESSNCVANESTKQTWYLRKILVEKMEKALMLCIQELIQKQIPINGELIKEKAIQFYNQLKDLEPSCSSSHIESPKFSANSIWLCGFLRRHSLHNLKIKDEAASADETDAKNYCKMLEKIIEDGGYCPDQVFNADETGLFWKKMPSRTFIAKSEKTASGFKASKDRVTFLLCTNASGARMLKPLMINRSLHPRALKGKNVAELPIHFMANKEAIVTTAVFITWFNDCFVPEVKQYMTEMGLPFKVLLILANAPGHPCIEHPNVKVIFLPPNMTSLLQPLDQGIITAFKKHYVKLTFRYILEKLECDALTLTEVWKKFSILDCINHAAAAITEIKQHTLNACWKAVWPECVINRSAAENSSMLTAEIVMLAHGIGGDGFNTFSVNDLMEMIQDETVRDDDINCVTDVTDGQEETNYMTADKIYAGLQLCYKLECHFLAIDGNSERTSKFQKELQSCISGYQDIYKRLEKQQSSQKLITDYMVTEKMSTLNECEVESSSDESDFEPVNDKKVHILSDYKG